MAENQLGQRINLKTFMIKIHEQLTKFSINAIVPRENNVNNRTLITEKSFENFWKIILFYLDDFQNIFTDELVNFNNVVDELEKNNVILLIGSSDSNFSKQAFESISKHNLVPAIYLFSDNIDKELSLREQLRLNKNNLQHTRICCIVNEKNMVCYGSQDDLGVVNSNKTMLGNLISTLGQIKN